MSSKTIWIIATKFPSSIQPWLANLVAQSVKHGNQVKIFSTEAADDVYAEIIDEYSLKEKCTTFDFTPAQIIKQAVKNFIHPRLFWNSLRGLLLTRNVTSKHKHLVNRTLTKLYLAPFLDKGQVDLIHSHFEISGHMLLPLVKAQKVPFVVTFHGLPPPKVSKLPEKMRREYFEAASIILVNTEFAKRQVAAIGAPPKKIRVLPQGTDLVRFSFNPKPLPERGPIRVLSTGRFSPEKGQEYSLRAIASLIHKGWNIEFNLVGEGPDKARLVSLTELLKIDQNVRFLSGPSEQELLNLYRDAHIFILASVKSSNGFPEETQGVVIQEAQASGALVIATKVGGIPECVEDGKSAFLVQDRNEAAIREKLEYLLNHPEHWSYWQRSARKLVELRYDINKIGTRLNDIYQSLIKRD